MSKSQVIEKSWLSYRTECIHAEAGQLQLIESRRAFYAGARALLTAITDILEPGEEATDADIAMLEAIHVELNDFMDALKAGKA